ncbi:Uncharacterised protein [Mycobacteroides abscessus subsp. abscessus]|nr:Uncharacterised protein [Mycobacteroides abscessus subsp. abscessus]SIC80234.1 Uncharacterised protein [Mycobacteroides abscessus subsp. abscessus]SKK32554.1 Uncharacterised protein [Mycobacteroides abscessus subsp. abscessus]SKP26212.1 Uncharacterised protein [Mycobacteroides abscessus subsp. abscessus]
MQIIADEWCVALKPHKCGMCGRQIAVSERYRSQRNKHDSAIWTWRNCAHCDELLVLLVAEGFDDGEGVSGWTVMEWHPETVAQARLKVGWKRKWRRRDGSLYPVHADHAA